MLPPVSRWSAATRPTCCEVAVVHSARDDVEGVLERNAQLLVCRRPGGTPSATARPRPPRRPTARRRGCGPRGARKRVPAGCPATARRNRARFCRPCADQRPHGKRHAQPEQAEEQRAAEQCEQPHGEERGDEGPQQEMDGRHPDLGELERLDEARPPLGRLERPLGARKHPAGQPDVLDLLARRPFASETNCAIRPAGSPAADARSSSRRRRRARPRRG